jgi:hypothetical protein
VGPESAVIKKHKEGRARKERGKPMQKPSVEIGSEGYVGDSEASSILIPKTKTKKRVRIIEDSDEGREAQKRKNPGQAESENEIMNVSSACSFRIYFFK